MKSFVILFLLVFLVSFTTLIIFSVGEADAKMSGVICEYTTVDEHRIEGCESNGWNYESGKRIPIMFTDGESYTIDSILNVNGIGATPWQGISISIIDQDGNVVDKSRVPTDEYGSFTYIFHTSRIPSNFNATYTIKLDSSFNNTSAETTFKILNIIKKQVKTIPIPSEISIIKKDIKNLKTDVADIQNEQTLQKNTIDTLDTRITVQNNTINQQNQIILSLQNSIRIIMEFLGIQ